jgi:hypothetical protein
LSKLIIGERGKGEGAIEKGGEEEEKKEGGGEGEGKNESKAPPGNS